MPDACPEAFNCAPQLRKTLWQIGYHGRSAPMLTPFPSLLRCAWCVGALHSRINLECSGFSSCPKEFDQVSVYCSNCCSVVYPSRAQIRAPEVDQRLASIRAGTEYHNTLFLAGEIKSKRSMIATQVADPLHGRGW